VSEGPSSDHDAALPWLWGARIERIDGPLPGLFALTLYSPGQKQCLVLAVSPSLRGVGTSETRPKGEAASAFVQRLRGKFEGARLVEARWLGGQDAARATALVLQLRRGDEEEGLVADFDAQRPMLVLLQPNGLVAGASDEAARRARMPDRSRPYEPPQGRGIARVLDEAAARAQAAHLLSDQRERGEQLLKSQARTTLRNAHKRAARKAEAIRGDLTRAEQGPLLRREATLLLCHLHELARGLSQVNLVDESVDPPEPLLITLDPAKDARLNAQQKFERARKLDRGAIIARKRLEEANGEVVRLEALLGALDGDDTQALSDALSAAGLSPKQVQRAPAKKREPQTHVAFRTFVGAGDRRILVGKGAADNDTLTVTLARPHDYFLHARGVTGAHVIIPRDKNAQVPPELLLDAAHLAAHFSDARGERIIEVLHTERRYVRKPKGAAVGAVMVDREKVLVLRVEPDRLTRLLAAEKRD
jgi:predicted ribosome quality control (RQC) complex YloA/Tae2 family protein